MSKYNVQLVFNEDDSLWYASFKSFSTDNWWYLSKDKCDVALLERVTGEIESNGWEIESVSYDSKERVNYDRSFT